MICAEITATPQFCDLDPMEVVWHGNYARFLEQARDALMVKIGYSYPQMRESGYVWPIVDMRIKYVQAVRYKQTIRVRATLAEYETRLIIHYRILDAETGAILTKATTVQVAVQQATGALQWVAPPEFLEKVQSCL